MAWNPETYNKFKSERFAPFYDLLELLAVKPGLQVIDLGCGTGELTGKLANELPGSNVLGIDSSKEMLVDSKIYENGLIKFECRSIEDQLNQEQRWDLVFSNAAIQWVDDHETLIPKIISTINANGQLLIQLPDQQQNISNKILNDLADEEPFRTGLGGWQRVSPVLDIDKYAQLLFENGGENITVFEKVYPLILKDSDALFDWVSGTALIPYTELLELDLRQEFVKQYKSRLSMEFDKSPVFYPFKRILFSATF